MITILFVNNAGGGFADRVQVDEGATLGQFVDDKVSGPSNFTIRLNRDVAARSEILKEGDRVTVTPNKMAVAA